MLTHETRGVVTWCHLVHGNKSSAAHAWAYKSPFAKPLHYAVLSPAVLPPHRIINLQTSQWLHFPQGLQQPSASPHTHTRAHAHASTRAHTLSLRSAGENVAHLDKNSTLWRAVFAAVYFSVYLCAVSSNCCSVTLEQTARWTFKRKDFLRTWKERALFYKLLQSSKKHANK